MKVQLEIGPRTEGDVPVVPTYRDPAVEAPRASRMERWRTHRIALASAIAHSAITSWNVCLAYQCVNAHRYWPALFYVFVAGGVNVLFLWWAWRRAKKTF